MPATVSRVTLPGETAIETGESGWLKIEVPYGETVLIWTFSGIKRRSVYTVEIPLIIDTRGNSSWVEAAVVGGNLTDADCIWPREKIRTGIQAKWDPNGGGDLFGRGNSSMGPVRLSLEGIESSDDGVISVVLVVGHWTRIPETVCQYVGRIEIKRVQTNALWPAEGAASLSEMPVYLQYTALPASSTPIRKTSAPFVSFL